MNKLLIVILVLSGHAFGVGQEPERVVPFEDRHLDSVIEICEQNAQWLDNEAYSMSRMLKDELTGPEREVFESVAVSESNNKVTGFICHSRCRIYLLAITPKMQSRGHGSCLLSYAENKMRTPGCSKRVSVCTTSENKRAQNFYAKHGYERVRAKNVVFQKEL